MLLRNITHNLSFADAQLLAKIRLKVILKQRKQYNLLPLRHDNDVEAEGKLRYKVLRAAKIQGNNFDSERAI